MAAVVAPGTGATEKGPGPADTRSAGVAPFKLPRIAIQFCTQCKWMLRAAYYAQELLSTFGPALGEVALQPGTGGVFTVTIEVASSDAAPSDTSPSALPSSAPVLLWDRKTDGGFPETKDLKRRVRDVVAPGRDLGHVDRPGKAAGGDSRVGSANAEATLAVPENATAITARASEAAPVPVPAPSGQTGRTVAQHDGPAGDNMGESGPVPVCEDCQ